MIGRLVIILEYLDAAHRGQRDPQIAVDRPDFLRGGQVQHEFAALDLQLRHSRLLSAPYVNRLTPCPPKGH